ncbi:SET and MYND domain-containing protein 3 [Rhizopus stolonifer]|uniref:SET and MYND domain-containing protein 3 n=1 Tax=Rhizopus stolonifer TaxID=4846 RepID=A0A367JHF6_RHIST|nr:SET and MYND domain-containing protein 3 [Rhizopus stolonifer]
MEEYLSCHHIALYDSKDMIRGRYIQAKTPIKKGTIIISSQPLGTVSMPQTRNEYCNYCFRKQSSTSLQRCSQCKKAYFCDIACFKNAWLCYHQYVCKSQSTTTMDAEDDMDLEMLERVALNVARYKKRVKGQKSDGGMEESVDVTMEAFFSLTGHDSIQRRYAIEKHNALATEALKKIFIQQTGLTQKELVHYLNIFKSNNFAIDDADMFAIGEGTYPIASLFNHSCRPNAVVMFDGALASIHAIEDIEPNIEITIAYVDAAHSRSYRQKALREKYFFNCQCERCVSGERPWLSLIDTLLGEEESDWDRAQELIESQNGKGSLDKRGRVLKQIEEWDLLQMCKIYDRKSDGCPDITKPLNIEHYTHYFIQFFAPYLLTWNQPELHQQKSELTQKTCLTDFDDPLPTQARPLVPSTYNEILKTAIEKMLSHPTNSATIIPYRLTTLSICTRLFYDEMAGGHWRNAVKLGMYILIQYCLIYPPYHPMLAQHFLMLAKACWNSIIQSELINDNMRLEQVYERGVRRWIMSSKETVAVAFGKHSRLWRETLELEWIFLREQKLK